MLLRWLIHTLVVPAVKERMMEAVRNETPPAAESVAADAPELPPCEIAILFGSGIEAESTVQQLSQKRTHRQGRQSIHAGLLSGHSVLVVECGTGGKTAAESTRAVLKAESPHWVVAAGFATGLCEGMRRGHVVMPDRLVDENKLELEVGFQIAPEAVEQTRGLHVGRLLSLDRLVRTPEDRRGLAAEYNAIACDAETMAIARVCSEHKTRFLAVRVISDAVDDRLPADVEALLNQSSLAGKLGAATGALFKRPSTMQDLWRIRDAGAKASDRLAKFLAGVMPQLT